MRRFVATIALGVAVFAGTAPAGQQPPPQETADRFAQADHACVLIAVPGNAFTYVRPPVTRRDRTGLHAEAAANIQVTYVGFAGFPSAQAAFQHAVDIWEGQLSSPVTIRVRAEFTPLGAGVLGSAGANFVRRDFSGAPVASTWYGDALADRLAGSDLGGGTFDILANFNSTFANWYLGTNGATPAGQYDFVSVVLHELGHGLGFFGSASVSGGSGTIGLSGFPTIYDRFAVTESNVPLLTFANPSAALGTQLTHNFNPGAPRGPGVYWNGPAGIAGNGGQTARLYTVNPWAPASSYSHLNEGTYPAGNANSLMTYALSAAEAIHNPGPVTLGLFRDMGWQSCAGTLTPSSATASKAGGAAQVAVLLDAGCAWTAVSNSAFITVTGGASGTGNGTVSYSVTPNPATTSRVGTITIAGTTFTVTQLGDSVVASPGALYFAGSNDNGALDPITPPQDVTVSFEGAGGTWSASADQPWVQITNGSGSGTGRFTVSIVNPGDVLGGVTHTTATVTITASNVTNSPVTTLVDLRLGATHAAPFGQVDSPSQFVVGLQGAVGVTGWLIDDVGAGSVSIYRDCQPIDNPASCQIVNDAYSVVFIGNAAFLAGARPDVEAAFPSYPMAHKAGWGMQILTNMLPHLPNGQLYGGEGSFNLYAFATDLDGHTVLLGRSPSDHTPTTVTISNDSIEKPFGTIDTPALGETVSGLVPNFGWALTPDYNTGPDTIDAFIPPDGSTMTVFIDGVATAQVAYDQCRGTVGNPVPGAAYCNDDISAIFGNATPQPPLTPRTSNPTRYRNLDAGRGAIGAYLIDTNTLSNGLHTIAWSVTDSFGRVEGIGSQFFTVLNGASRTERPASTKPPASTEPPAFRQGESPPDLKVGGSVGAALADLLNAPVISRGSARDIESLRRSRRSIAARTGFDPATPMRAVAPGADGARAIAVAPEGRVEIGLAEPVTAAYLVVNGQLRDLPIGSTLDARTGMFAWTPPPGYFGRYHLAFLTGRDRVDVDVTVGAALAPRQGSGRR